MSGHATNNPSFSIHNQSSIKKTFIEAVRSARGWCRVTRTNSDQLNIFLTRLLAGARTQRCNICIKSPTTDIFTLHYYSGTKHHKYLLLFGQSGWLPQISRRNYAYLLCCQSFGRRNYIRRPGVVERIGSYMGYLFPIFHDYVPMTFHLCGAFSDGWSIVCSSSL